MEKLLKILGLYSVVGSFGSLFSIALYVLQALGLYTLAQRRGIRHAWLAWIPVGSMWILGSIADDYQLKTKGLAKNRRKLLMVLTAVVVVVAIILCVSLFGSVFELIGDLESLERRSPGYTTYEYDSKMEDILEDFVMSFLSMGLFALVLSAVSIAAMVFQYICLYDLFASCDPGNKVLYLVLSIFISGLSGVFVFVCRNKDQGMYPPAPYGYPYQQPPYQQGPGSWQ